MNETLIWAAITINAAQLTWLTLTVRGFDQRLKAAAKGASDHYEALRANRQRGS